MELTDLNMVMQYIRSHGETFDSMNDFDALYLMSIDIFKDCTFDNEPIDKSFIEKKMRQLIFFVQINGRSWMTEIDFILIRWHIESCSSDNDYIRLKTDTERIRYIRSELLKDKAITKQEYNEIKRDVNIFQSTAKHNILTFADLMILMLC